MASNTEISFISFLLLCTLISCSLGQTFQYSRGWVNGKRSGAVTSNAKLSEHSLNNDEMPDICKQFFLSELLARSNPISVHVIAHDYATNSQHSAAFYQRPQIKHESDLVASAPYGFVETPLSLNALELGERYKRMAKNNIYA